LVSDWSSDVCSSDLVSDSFKGDHSPLNERKRMTVLLLQYMQPKEC